MKGVRRQGLDKHRSGARARTTAWLLCGLLAIAFPALSIQESDSPGDTEAVDTQSGDVSDPETPGGEDPEDDGEHPDENSDSEEAPKVATLIFTTDAPCSLIVGGISKGSLEPGEPLEVEVESLELRVTAIATDVMLARWDEDFELELDEIREIAVPMLEAIEDQRKKERREQVFRYIDLGLMWARRDNARDVAWAGAEKYCEDLELGGFDDWHLPSLAELETLESMWSMRALKVADQILLTACCLWSSTEGADNTVWNLDFRFRREFEVNRNLSFGLRALCRREMPAEELAEARLIADPKEQKRRLKEKRRRQDERKRRKEAKAQPEASAGGSESLP